MATHSPDSEVDQKRVQDEARDRACDCDDQEQPTNAFSFCEDDWQKNMNKISSVVIFIFKL